MASNKSTSDTATEENSRNNDSDQRSTSDEQKVVEEKKTPADALPAPRQNIRFWMIMTALCTTGLLAAFENTVVTTSLPTIVTDFKVGQNYVWITNVFFLTSAAFQPLVVQIANIFGWRRLTMFIVAVYTLRSGICGGAHSGGMLIAGRGIQGIGSGGVNIIVDVIVSDLVPLRQRRNYVSIVLIVYSIGTSLGPFIGGAIVDSTSWRWVFYVNLPVGGISLVMLYAFLRVNWNKKARFSERLDKIDFVGNGILMASSVGILWALTYDGTRFTWSSWHTIVPLVLGFVGYGLFIVFEGSKLCKEPAVPLRLFAHRTAGIVYINTFLSSTLLYWTTFFLPVYFQAVKLSTATRAGVQMLPIVLVAVPGAAIAVLVLAKWGRCKQLHYVGFALMALGIGLSSMLDQRSSTAEWVIFQIIAALGSGMILNTLLPAFQAGLEESDQAAATAIWSLSAALATSGGVGCWWPSVRECVRGFVSMFSGPAKEQLIAVFVSALALVWQVGIAFAGLAFVLSFFEKEIKLRDELETEFGIAGGEQEGQSNKE